MKVLRQVFWALLVPSLAWAECAFVDFDANSNIIRVLALATDGTSFTTLAHDTSGLKVGIIANNSDTPATYTTTNLETITTAGTYAAPTSGKVRVKEVHESYHPGIIEIQAADALFDDAGSKSLIVSLTGVTGMRDIHCQVQLLDALPEVTLSTAASTELSTCPTATASQADQLQYLFMRSRNKFDEASGVQTVYRDDGSTGLCEMTSGDNGTAYTRGEAAAP